MFHTYPPIIENISPYLKTAKNIPIAETDTMSQGKHLPCCLIFRQGANVNILNIKLNGKKKNPKNIARNPGATLSRSDWQEAYIQRKAMNKRLAKLIEPNIADVFFSFIIVLPLKQSVNNQKQDCPK